MACYAILVGFDVAKITTRFDAFAKGNGGIEVKKATYWGKSQMCSHHYDL
jgi:hypothetical protein